MHRVLIALVLLFAAAPALAQICQVSDPSGTPLNVRATPNGNKVGTLNNDDLVTILDQASDRAGKAWVYVGREDRSPIGWVYRDYIRCSSRSAEQPPTGPSFNCRYAKSSDEVAICQVPKLAEMDVKLASLYFGYRSLTYGQARVR
jgi:hypothetical protein